MDVKVDGVPLHILVEALEKTRLARLHILEIMAKEIASPRDSISARAPEILTLKIDPDKIGLVIGGGGKTINGIKEDSGVEEINIEDDGTIFITGKNGTANLAKEKIETLTKDYSVGDEVEVTIVKLVDFGAFAKIDSFNEGLIHISEIAPYRIETVKGLLEEGEVVSAAVSKVENGKIGLSIKQVDPDFAKRKGFVAPEINNIPQATGIEGNKIAKS
jgi:polyribonucleotide nucleotidyltransferase